MDLEYIRKMLLVNAPFLVPLMLLSVLSLAIIIERTFFLLRQKTHTANLLQNLINLFRTGRIEKVIDSLDNERCVEASLLREAFYYVQEQGVHGINSVMEGICIKQAKRLEVNLPVLHSIANISTLLGLLGTVTGMIITFYQGVQTGFSSPLLLINGIWQALISTAFGLIVAIPASMAASFFSTAAQRRIQNMEILTREMVAFLKNPS